MGYFLTIATHQTPSPILQPSMRGCPPPLGGTGAEETRHRRKRKRGEKKEQETGGSDNNTKKVESKIPLRSRCLVVSVLICSQVNNHSFLPTHQSRDSSAVRASD